MDILNNALGFPTVVAKVAAIVWRVSRVAFCLLSAVHSLIGEHSRFSANSLLMLYRYRYIDIYMYIYMLYIWFIYIYTYINKIFFFGPSPYMNPAAQAPSPMPVASAGKALAAETISLKLRWLQRLDVGADYHFRGRGQST